MDVREIEKIGKGIANHHRLKILLLLDQRSGLTLSEITKELQINFRTASEHTKKLVAAGLITKKYSGSFVEHEISQLGKHILKFLRAL